VLEQAARKVQVAVRAARALRAYQHKFQVCGHGGRRGSKTYLVDDGRARGLAIRGDLDLLKAVCAARVLRCVDGEHELASLVRLAARAAASGSAMRAGWSEGWEDAQADVIVRHSRMVNALAKGRRR
jgi:hypothetical protein